MAEILSLLMAIGLAAFVANRIVELLRNLIRLRNEWLERTPHVRSRR